MNILEAAKSGDADAVRRILASDPSAVHYSDASGETALIAALYRGHREIVDLLIDSGAVIANGTDTPVEDVDPIACFAASVTRRMADGTAFYPEQKMTREEALRSYTLNGAYASFEEDIKGSITPGKLADIVVLSKDILKVPDAEVPTAKVALTILGGQVRWRR